MLVFFFIRTLYLSIVKCRFKAERCDVSIDNQILAGLAFVKRQKT